MRLKRKLFFNFRKWFASTVWGKDHSSFPYLMVQLERAYSISTSDDFVANKVRLCVGKRRKNVECFHINNVLSFSGITIVGNVSPFVMRKCHSKLCVFNPSSALQHTDPHRLQQLFIQTQNYSSSHLSLLSLSPSIQTEWVNRWCGLLLNHFKSDVTEMGHRNVSNKL